MTDEPKQAPEPRLTPDQVAILAAGTGFVADMARTCLRLNIPFDLDAAACRNAGAGSVSDQLKQGGV